MQGSAKLFYAGANPVRHSKRSCSLMVEHLSYTQAYGSRLEHGVGSTPARSTILLRYVTMDTNIRTIAKTASYRTITFVLTYILTLLIVGAEDTSAIMAILSLTVGAVSFYVHERLWTRVRWGNFGGIDFKIRSATKTLTYRLWSLLIVFVLGLVVGLQSSQALSLTVILNIMYLLTHYANERVWNNIKWGKV